MILNAIHTQDSVSFSSKQFRGITYLKEVAENMDKVILLPGGAYNFGSEITQSIYEVTNKFVDMLGKRLIVKDAPARHNLWMDCSKARKYGVEFSSVIDGLERCARDYKLYKRIVWNIRDRENVYPVPIACCIKFLYKNFEIQVKNTFIQVITMI